MRVAIGSYVSNGTRNKIDIGFAPDQVYIKGDAAVDLAQRCGYGWCARSSGLGAVESYIDGIKYEGESVIIGASTRINQSGTRYYWCAIGEDGDGDYETVSYSGNGQNGHTLTLRNNKTPIALVSKRDSAAPAVAKFPNVASVTATGTAVAECVSAISNGSVTLTSVINVNEWDGIALGEGIDMLVGYGGNFKVASWSAGTSGQFVGCGGDPLAAIIFRVDATGVPAHFVTRDMPSAAPVTAAAIAANTATLVPGGIVLGSAATLRTGTFYAIVFCRKDTTKKYKPPAIVVKERKGVYLPGRGVAAQVDCGTSDATLKINGAITLEWYGVAWPDQYSSVVGVHLLERGVGPSATAGAYSWGLGAVQVKDLSWSGAQIAAIAGDRWAEAEPLSDSVWRTGILMPWGRPCHIVHVHEGNGVHRMYLNGVLVKQRTINLPVNIVSGAGHRTGMGMRRNTADTAWTQAQRMIILSARVYAGALNAGQVASRFAREVMGSTEADITEGLAESWDARNASGLAMPATVNAANNGAISSAGRVIVL